MKRMDNGLILGNTLSKIVLFEEFERSMINDNDKIMIKLKFEKDISSTIVAIDCFEDYILIGDPYKLVNLYLYNQVTNKIVCIARDTR